MVEPHPHNVRILLTAGQLLFVLYHVMCVRACVRARACVRMFLCLSVCLYIHITPNFVTMHIQRMYSGIYIYAHVTLQDMMDC